MCDVLEGTGLRTRNHGLVDLALAEYTFLLD